MSMIRVRLKILPYGEKLLLLLNENATIMDVKAETFRAIQYYPVYKEYLQFCSIHLELQINDNDIYAVPDHYQLKDLHKESDMFVVSFIDNKQFANRQSIHMKYQGQSQQTQSNNNNNNQMQIQQRHQTERYLDNTANTRGDFITDVHAARSPEFNPSPEPYGNQRQQQQLQQVPQSSNTFNSNEQFQSRDNNKNPMNNNNYNANDDGQATLEDINRWVVSDLGINGVLHATYRADYKQFIQRLQDQFPVSLTNIVRASNQPFDLQTFLLHQMQLHIVKISNQWAVQYEVPSNMNNNSNYNNNNNMKPMNHIQSKQKQKNKKNDNQDNNDRVQIQPPLHSAVPSSIPSASSNVSKPDIPSIPMLSPPQQQPSSIKIPPQMYNNGNQKKSKKRKPAQSELPSTPDSPSEDEQDEEEEEENQDDINNDNHEVQEMKKISEFKQTEEIIPETVANGSPENEPSTTVIMADTKTAREYLPDILCKSYSNLCESSKAPSYISKYVVLSKLEREVKNMYRETTPYELNIAEFDYINFTQLLMMEFKQITVQIVHCEKELMCKKRGDYFEAKSPQKVKKGGKLYDACPEIETYVVVINDLIKTEQNDNDMEEDDGKKQSFDPDIEANIKYLKQCNVVDKMKPSDIYYHIKLLHSECSLRDIDRELNQYGNGMGYHHGMRNGNNNSFDDIASELRENNINGKRLLEMKWSKWEMLHDLDRYDVDHQDFIEDIMIDFFNPFITGELLSNQIGSLQKMRTGSPSMFENIHVRSKLTLCIDYGLFPQSYPILHFMIKVAELNDCERLLRLHPNLSVDTVVGEYNCMHIAAWRGKFKLLAAFTRYGGNPMIKNLQGETAFVAGRNHQQKLKWYYAQFPQFMER